ncbi:MAG: 7-carboxy-7-deazaguanine synthase QueE [Pirellulaceae bacterium]|nr:7-carboxy-7-deazaguanine synthase QueE [Pirellulaceae bacterium]
MRICEIYHSRQGEGLLTGTPSVFVRTSGCNLRCWFCDTPFASWHPEGDYRTVEDIVRQVQTQDARHVVLTGGEPMIWGSVVELSHALQAAGYHLTIETAGTIWHAAQVDLWSISPKLTRSAPTTSGSWPTRHEQRRQRLDVVRHMMQKPYQLKFVVDTPDDAREVLDYLRTLGNWDPQRVLLMPQGTDRQDLDQRAQWLIPWCQQHGLQFCPRQHIYWFGNRRGT